MSTIDPLDLATHRRALEAMLCCGCDHELGPNRFCPNCAEVMPVYPEPAEPFLQGRHPVHRINGRVDRRAVA